MPLKTILLSDGFDRPDSNSLGKTTQGNGWQENEGGSFQSVSIEGNRLAFDVASGMGAADAHITQNVPAFNAVRLRAKLQRSACSAHVTVLMNATLNGADASEGFGVRWAACTSGSSSAVSLWNAGTGQAASAPISITDGGPIYVQVSIDPAATVATLDVTTGGYAGECGASALGSAPGSVIGATGSWFQISRVVAGNTTGQAFVDEVELGYL